MFHSRSSHWAAAVIFVGLCACAPKGDSEAPKSTENAAASAPTLKPAYTRDDDEDACVGAGGSFGAIAYASATANGHFVTGCQSREMAERAVLAGCRNLVSGAATCEVALWFQNACGALAQGENGAYGTGWAGDGARACSWAFKSCVDEGGRECEGVYFACSPGDAGGTCDGTVRKGG